MNRSGVAGADEHLRAHLAAIVRSSDDAIISKDLDGIITSWNAGATRLYGYTEEEAIGQPVSMLVPEDLADEIPSIMDRLRRGEQVDHYETVRETKDGRRLDISLTVSPIVDREGRVMGASAVGRDITERKRAEQVMARDLREHKRLHEISCRLIPAGDIEALYRELIDAAIEITEADCGTMQSLESVTGELCLLAARNMPRQVWDMFARVSPDSHTSCGKALSRGERVVLDYLTDQRVAGTEEARAHLDLGIRAAQSTPLRTRSGKVVGMLSTHWKQVHDPSERELHLLDVLARQAADLIERAEADQTVREGEQRSRLRAEQFETLVNQAPLGVYFVDADFRVQQVNPVAEPIFSGFPEGVIGRDFEEILHAMWNRDRAAEIVRIFRHTLETGESVHVPEFADTRADRGVTEYYDWRAERIVRPDGRYGVVCYFHDVSHEVSARLAIAESEARYRTLFESIEEGFCVIEVLFDEDDEPVDYRFLEMNPAFERHTGLADAVGERARALVPDLERRWFETYGRIAKTGERERFVEHSPAMGRWFEVEAFRVGEPERRRVALLFSDITDRKKTQDALRESEERLRLAKAAAGLGIHDYNVVSGEIGWDDRTREIWGVGEDEPVTYEIWRAGLHPDDRDRVEAALQRALDPVGDGAYFAEHRVTCRTDGVMRWIEVTGQTAFSNGRAVRLVGTVQDITDQKQAEAALREADRRKDEFLATLAHELRSPLAAIRTAMRVVGTVSDDPARVDEMTMIIERQSAQLVRLIDDLLDVSRISLGKVKLDRKRVDVAEIVRQVYSDSLAGCEEKGVEPSSAIPELPIMVDADSVRIAQVLNNLLHNARKFTPGGGKIRVAVEREGEEAVVRVADTGVGMPPGQLSRVFEMFAQGGDSPDRGSGGLGIGLSLSRSIVELHGGTIEARSEGPGKGSEFVVRLPVSDRAARRREAAEEPVASEQPAERATGRRIVLAEDHDDSLHVVALMLRMKGHEVETAVNGTEALEKVRTHRPEIALLDIGMPEMNGYEVARRIRQEPWGGDMLLIAMTGWGQEKDKERAFEAGFDEHLTKPMDLKSLEALLASYGERGGSPAKEH